MIRNFLKTIAIAAFVVTSAAAQSANANVAANSKVAGQMNVVPEPPAKSVIRGRVYYADNARPVRRASIMLMREDLTGGEGEFSGLTDNEGNFQIKNVRAGAYYAMINAPGVVSPMAYAAFNKGNDKEAFADAFTQFEKLVVDGSNDIDVQLPAIRGGAISGRVMYQDGDPAVGVRVEVLHKIGERFVPVISNYSAIFAMLGGGSQTDDRGVYRFAGLPRGEYKVKVTENITHTDSRRSRQDEMFMALMGGGNSLVSIYYPEFFDSVKAKIVEVEMGAEQFEINVMIPDHSLYRMEGKVVAGKDKKPLKGTTISLKRKGDDNEPSIFNQMGRIGQTAEADEEGKWSFKELPAGDYEVIVEPSDQTGDEMARAMNAMANAANAANRADGGMPSMSNVSLPPRPPRLAKMMRQVTIEDKNVSELVFEMDYGATLSGTVSVQNSQEVPRNVSITAVDDSEQLSTSDSVNSFVADDEERALPPVKNAKNTFKLESVAAGKTYLRVMVNDDRFYVKSATADGKDLLTDPIELKAGQNIVNIKVVLGTDVGTFKGNAIDDKKDPVKAALFTLVPTDSSKCGNPSFYRNVTADEKGEFTIKAGPVEYAIVFNLNKKTPPKNHEEFLKWINEAIKNAPKVTIEANETTTQKLAVPSQ